MAPGEGDLVVRTCTGCLKMRVDGVGRLNDPDGADGRPDITQRAMSAGSHMPPPPWPTSVWHFHY